MARIRTIKPEFWTDEKIVECSTTARLLFIGLWNFCDDYGSHQYSPKQIKMEVFPGDDFKISKVEEWILELINACLIKVYTVEDKRYLRVCGWRHQKIEKPSRKYPEPIQFDDHSTTDRRPFDDDSPAEGKGRERKGKEERQGRERECEGKGNQAPDPEPVDNFTVPGTPSPPPSEKPKNGNGLDEVVALYRHVADKYESAAVKRQIWLFVENNQGRNMEALAHCLESILKSKKPIQNPRAYLEKAMAVEDGKFNAAESERLSNQIKAAPVEVPAIAKNMFKPMPDGPDPHHADKVKAQARAILGET